MSEETCVDLAPADLRIGLSTEFVREICAEDLLIFGSLSGDVNPLHVDPVFAGQTAFRGQVAHGALLIGFVSALVGTRLPGRRVLVTGFNARFGTPVRVPETVRVSGQIVAWNLELRSGRLAARVEKAASRELFAEVGVSFTVQDLGEEARPVEVPAVGSTAEKGKWVLVTGASGGLGKELVAALALDYDVITLSRQTTSGSRRHIVLDLSAPDWECSLDRLLPDKMYAVVHAAWPGAPRGGLLGSSSEILRQQLSFGTDVPVGLARILSKRVGAEGGRFVAIGSQVAHTQNLRLGSYVLGKSALETTVALLAKELAARRVACNVISPGFMPIGVNSRSSERGHLQEKAGIPFGRLCSTNDVVAAARYLLGSGSEFHTGRVIALWGGQS